MSFGAGPLFDAASPLGSREMIEPGRPLPSHEGPLSVARARPVGVPASVALMAEQASTAERHSRHDERREDQRRGEMAERLPIS